MAKVRGNKKRFQYCTDPSGQKILYLRALQGHSGRNPIDSFIAGQCINSKRFLRVHYSHRMCGQFTHSIMNSGLIPGGQKFMSKRQTVFFTVCGSNESRITIDLDLTWMHRVLLGTSRKRGRNIKTRCTGSTSNLLKRKDLGSIKHDRTQSSFTTRSQLIVTRRLS